MKELITLIFAIVSLAGCSEEPVKQEAASAKPEIAANGVEVPAGDYPGNAIGRKFELWNPFVDDGATFLGSKPEDFNDFMTTMTNQDKEGMAALLMQEKVIAVKGNTPATLTDTAIGGTLVKMRVAGGAQIGKEGWTHLSWVVPEWNDTYGKKKHAYSKNDIKMLAGGK